MFLPAWCALRSAARGPQARGRVSFAHLYGRAEARALTLVWCNTAALFFCFSRAVGRGPHPATRSARGPEAQGRVISWFLTADLKVSHPSTRKSRRYPSLPKPGKPGALVFGDPGGLRREQKHSAISTQQSAHTRTLIFSLTEGEQKGKVGDSLQERKRQDVNHKGHEGPQRRTL